MPEEPTEQVAAHLRGIARSFARLGWIGFWLQVALATLPILLLLYVLLSKGSGSMLGRGIDLRDYVAFGSLLILLFTTWWCYRYTRIATRMRTPGQRPPSSSVIRTLWIGVVASCLGAFISALLVFASAGRLLFVLMVAPQGGMPVIQTAADDRTRWVSAMDMMDLMTLSVTLTAELTVLAFTLWLLFRMIQRAITYDRDDQDTSLLEAEPESSREP